jgi:hypothetical protein
VNCNEYSDIYNFTIILPFHLLSQDILLYIIVALHLLCSQLQPLNLSTRQHGKDGERAHPAASKDPADNTESPTNPDRNLARCTFLSPVPFLVFLFLPSPT